MNDLSTSKPSGSQNIWSSLPWKTFLFLLAVFVCAAPLIKFSVFNWEVSVDDPTGVGAVMDRDNWMRIGALLSLGAFALFNLSRHNPDHIKINGLLGWLILFYLTWAALSIIWSVDPRYTTKRVGIFLLLSLAALYIAYRFSLQEIIALAFFICAAAILLGLIHALLIHNFHPFLGAWRFGGNMHPNVQGWHIGILLLSALAFANIDKQNRAVYIGITFIALIFIILTRSRGAFISCFVGAAVYLGLSLQKGQQRLLVFFSIIIAGCLVYFFFGNELLGVSDKIITLGRVGEIESTNTLTGRIPLWKDLMSLVNQRPLVGFGYDSFLTGENLVWVSKTMGWATNSPHSGYIGTLGGLGYIGAVPLVLILFLSLTMSIRLVERNSNFAFVAAVLVWLIINLYLEDKILTRPFIPILIWMSMVARLGFIRKES